MTVSMPDLFRIDVTAAAVTAARTDMLARGHVVITDEPKERGGTDLHATPLETLLSAFLGCTNVITHFVAGQMGVKLRDLKMSVSADFDTRGVFGRADVTVPFPDVRLRVELDTDASEEAVQRLRELVGRKCPVSVILRQAGCRIEEQWVLAK
ncbi:OsmC family protein [Granulosicoccus sp. 3-233]|uniref:OsmC family protein n=1 Tax=Granulosicoccus sp. 3-233 TaxID=3417969 RepID=UPI003D351D38